MEKWRFSHGLQDLGKGCYAYLQPDGGWGWSNAGLITDGEASLLVDTLFDEDLTANMLRAMRDAAPAAQKIDTLVNTHANGDHCYGNGLVKGAEIIASEASAREMNEVPPEMLAQFIRNADQLGLAGKFFKECFSVFNFEAIQFRKPTRTFSKGLDLKVGDKDVRLIEVGPAHTAGDVLVYSPSDKVVYTGDILFIDGTPIMWNGPIKNWLKACDLITNLDVEAIVPGHGPITDKAGVARMRGYLEYINQEARKRFDAGMSAREAALDIALGPFADWSESERVMVNVNTLFNEYRGEASPFDPVALFEQMALYKYKQ